MIELYIITIWLIIGWLASNGVKSQFVRLIDVFFIGPILIYSGLRFCTEECSDVDTIFKYSLLSIGAATISYNLKNYVAESSN